MNALPPLNALPLSPRWLLLWAQPNGLQSHLPNPPVSVILSGSPLAFSFIALTATYDYIFIVRLVLLLFFFFFGLCHGLRDFSSLARDQTWALGSESAES